MIARYFFVSLILAIVSGGAWHAQAQLGAHANTGRYTPSFARLRDTLFLLDTSYLEIQLDRQQIIHRFKSGRADIFPCSTGTPMIKDGIATRPGIFTVQSKARKTLSQEFQVYLNYWMGFDGGIGFHGLDSRSYYRHLGHRPSSHGCVRISNESGARLFGVVSLGTVVFVHGASPARVVAFADSAEAGLAPIYDIGRGVLKQRIDAVSGGRWRDTSLARRLMLPARKRLTERLDVGSVDQDLTVQFAIPIITQPFKPAPLRVHPIGAPRPAPPLKNTEED